MASTMSHASTDSSTPSVVDDAAPEAKPAHVALNERLTEYDAHTIGLTTCEQGSKIAKCGSHYSYQAPGFSQSLYRWFVGESQETTKQYIEELVTGLVALMDEGETMLEKLAVERHNYQQTLFGRRRPRFVSKNEGLRGIISTPPTAPPAPISAERIQEVAGVLKHVDELNRRIAQVIAHVQTTYADVSVKTPPAEAVEGDDDVSVSESEEDGDIVQTDVYDKWQARLAAAHSALCTASTSFRS